VSVSQHKGALTCFFPIIIALQRHASTFLTKGPSRNKIYKYDAGILASGKTPARSISAWIRNERATRPEVKRPSQIGKVISWRPLNHPGAHGINSDPYGHEDRYVLGKKSTLAPNPRAHLLRQEAEIPMPQEPANRGSPVLNSPDLAAAAATPPLKQLGNLGTLE